MSQTFKQTPDDANNYITNPQFAANIESQQNTKLDTLTRVQSALVDNLPRGFDDCVLWAR